MVNLVSPTKIKDQKDFGDIRFPFVLTPNENDSEIKETIQTLEDACDWVKTNKAHLNDQLLEKGAILFRGFPLKDARDFDKFIGAFGKEPLPYVGGAAPRKVITPRVFTANEAPPDQLIPFHHEMAQVPTFPRELFFFCETAPSTGGQTPLVLSNKVYRRMVDRFPEYVKDLEEKKVVYTRVLPNGDDPASPIGRGWQSTFQTEDRNEVERKCREQGTSFEWLPDGCLKTISAPLPAIKEDPRNGNKVWFNSIIAVYRGWRDSRNDPQKAITFGDGSPMPPEVMDGLEAILEDLAADVTWQRGDVYFIDNMQVLHARRSFTPPRRILASLVK
ncbi:taurine catabolism dioxygenase TauD/TfdA [Elysia marginata]|uniref:Taurine catabolism dioxygenase TauD/TfdA n=1 Tax=Elysia marginata TaxID=1093978 RepID=A0AAV4JQL0_9GAST|nr:taurine catabolism dioxygenase TauD/TfdA [Elysia marginata]